MAFQAGKASNDGCTLQSLDLQDTALTPAAIALRVGPFRRSGPSGDD